MVPIRTNEPLGAIGCYWAEHHQPLENEMELLSSLADGVAVAMENLQAYQVLEQRVEERTAALQESETRYRLLFELAPDPILLIDPESGEFLEFNSLAHEALGYTRDEFERLGLRGIQADGSPEGLPALKGLPNLESDDLEIRLRAKTGQIRDYRVNLGPLSQEENFIQKPFSPEILLEKIQTISLQG